MTTHARAPLDAVARRVLADLGPCAAWDVEPAWPDSLALAVIDAALPPSERAALLSAYVEARRATGTDPATDGLEELRATLPQLPDTPARAQVGEVAARLAATGVLTAEHLRHAHELNRARLAQVWHGAPGQASGAGWARLLVLLGIDDGDPDLVVATYLGSAVGRRLDARGTAEVLQSLARALDTDPATLARAVRARVCAVSRCG
ncbi:hypothetical protein [Nocardioides flavescens]|uniref:Uncharacterized protein n=1 Tax=Nocardioides flavescens TaxID=2691959 RepID=A0A6L7EZJ3_9ACTN|nr:hypothetical protein [Nocardioides flavescens]MXG89769.1 hypothetical protein [Nocardioides flavescens]